MEPEFSACGFRKSERRAKGQPMCPEDVPVGAEKGACLYSSRKGYLYWERTVRHETLASNALPVVGCPFGGPEWQLWVNHVLVHAEASARGAKHARFAVCAPAGNVALLRRGVLEQFRSRLARPETFLFVPLDSVLAAIASAVADRSPVLQAWSAALVQRYGSI